MPASGLGNTNCEITPRNRVMVNLPPKPCTGTSSATHGAKSAAAGNTKTIGRLSVPKGFLPTLLYSAFFFIFPVLNDYVEYDYSDTLVRTSVIAASVLAPIIVVGANDCVAWFNMALAFHTGVEVIVVKKLLAFNDNRDESDEDMVLTWVAFAVIVGHLIPFFVADRAMWLGVFASAGIVANTVVNVVVDPEMLLLTGFSSTVLLASVLLIACIDCLKTSLLSQLRLAAMSGSWCSVSSFEY